MKKIEVEIIGESPLLMHSAQSMEESSIQKNPTRLYDSKIDAEKVAYRNKDGELYVPSRCVKACLVNASSWYKFGKKGAKPIIAGCTRIEPMEILLGTKDYVIDKRPVVIQKSRIIRARPRLDNWKLKFYIIYNENIIKDVGIIKMILEESGQRIGLLDNRPQRYGENGTFKIGKWKEL